MMSSGTSIDFKPLPLLHRQLLRRPSASGHRRCRYYLATARLNPTMAMPAAAMPAIRTSRVAAYPVERASTPRPSRMVSSDELRASGGHHRRR